jgi:hypothetical protein
LRVDDLAIGLAGLEQLVVRAHADDRAAIEDDDLVGGHDRADPLRDDHDRGVPDLARERGAQVRVGAQVECREAVVEDVDRRALHERAGDRETLALAAREVRARLADRRLEAVGQVADERLGLGDPEGRPQLVVGGVRLAEAEVAGDRAREQEGLLRDQADPIPEVLALDVADVDAVDVERALGDVVEARDQVDERALAAAGAADDRGRPARRDVERDVVQDRVLGAGIAELDVPERHRARRRGRGDRLRLVADGRRRPQDLLDPAGRHDAARDHHEHEDGHHHGEQDLHHVLEERDEVADRHLTAVHADAAEPQDRDRRQVEDQHHGRDHHGEQAVDPQGRVGQVAVGGVEPLLLVVGPDERADHADAGECLARDLVDPVDLLLHRLEQGQGPAHQDPDDQRHERQDHHQDPRQRHVLLEGEDHTPDREDRGDDHHVQAEQDDHLDLLDVVRVARDQRWRAESVELRLRERFDLAEDRRAHVPPERHACLRAEEDGDDRRDDDDQRDAQHQHPRRQDVGGVALGDAVVDDVAVQCRQVQGRDRLDEQERDHDRERSLVRGEVRPQQRDHDEGSWWSRMMPRRRSNSARSDRWSAEMARRIVSMRIPDSSSRKWRPFSVSVVSTTRRSSDRWRRSTRPWRSIRSTNPVAAAGVRSKTSPIRPIGCGPVATDEEQEPKLTKRDVPGRGRRHLARHAVEDREEAIRRAGQELVIGRGRGCGRDGVSRPRRAPRRPDPGGRR